MTCFRLGSLGAFVLPVLLALAGCDEGGDPPATDASADAGADASVTFDASADAGVDASDPGDAASEASFAGDASAYAIVTTVLTPVPGANTTLVAGEPLVVRVSANTTGGAPVPGVRFDFSLLGEPLDSTLSAFYGTTDEKGELEVYVFGGQLPTSFQLRVASEHSLPVYAQITVVATEWLSLGVSIDASLADLVGSASLAVWADRTCDSLGAVPPSFVADFPTGSLSTEMLLPTGVDYAVVVCATDVTGLVKYKQCFDGVDPAALGTLTATLGLVR